MLANVVFTRHESDPKSAKIKGYFNDGSRHKNSVIHAIYPNIICHLQCMNYLRYNVVHITI